jgi:hypothetical protein
MCGHDWCSVRISKEINEFFSGKDEKYEWDKPKKSAALTAEQQAVCAAAYGEGVRQSMSATVLFFVPAAAFYLLASLTLKKDMVAKPV